MSEQLYKRMFIGAGVVYGTILFSALAGLSSRAAGELCIVGLLAAVDSNFVPTVARWMVMVARFVLGALVLYSVFALVVTTAAMGVMAGACVIEGNKTCLDDVLT